MLKTESFTTKEWRDSIFLFMTRNTILQGYNYYLGAKGILNGDSKIYEQNKKMGVGKREWKKTIDEIRCTVSDTNIEYVIEKKHLTVAGEFQFGNWALIYRDLFRLLNADDNPGIDFYIYVAATGR